MSALYSHTTRATGTILTASIYNSDHENHVTNGEAQYLGGHSDDVAQMRLTADPGESGSESLSSSIADELLRLRFAVLELKQAMDASLSYWYESPGELAGLPRLPPWYIDGLELTVAAATPAYIRVATGVCRSADDTINMRVSSPLHRTVSALWVTAATGGGVGVSWVKFIPYHVFVIKTGASAFDIGFDTAITASNVLARASGTKYRRIGSLNTATTAGAMKAVLQIGDHVMLNPPPYGNTTGLAQTASGIQAFALVKLGYVPTGVRLLVNVRAFASDTMGRFCFHSAGDLDQFVSAPNQEALYNPSVGPIAAWAWTSASGDVRYTQYGGGASTVKIVTLGWKDERK